MKIKLGAEVAPEDTAVHTIFHLGSVLIWFFSNKNFLTELLYIFKRKFVHTDDTEDVSDVGYKDDKQIDSKEEAHSNGYVMSPVKRFLWENQLQ